MGKMRVHNEDILVVGMGRFGGAVATELHRLGNRVTAVELDHALAESYLGRVGRIVQGDATNVTFVEELRPAEFSGAVLGIGSSVEASVLAAVNLIDAGAPKVWAKAVSPEHARILARIGVQHVLSPEIESGQRLAHLVGSKLIDYIEFDDGFAIVKMIPPKEAVGFTLEQSQIRSRYGVTVVGVKPPGEDFTHARPETKVHEGDTIIVSGPTSLIERMAARP
ncbi:TrkA family potassium uptake protein [Marihabitans asiaticum]|uniref:Trk system potassium uptake protein TrkA n=1 Tax=Marihabitans asiaticum TaxID=415218 RepID=A0A560WDV8_9MICO|nr:TrkA family potassium uptake protein [Marihabitans asiaticum]TWD15645.1 trk system potassium uptake protein TrkA [Marihabitans asiaticum]